MSIIYPVKIPDLRKDIKGPLVFFGGPDRGGGDWRKKAYELFTEKFGDEFCAAMPCQYEDSHQFAKLRLPRPVERTEGEQPSKEQPLRRWTRLDWIEYVADMAAIHLPQGCAVYWFPVESATEPRSDGMPYAMKSLFEIGLLLGRMMYDRNKIRFVLGMEPEFPGRRALIANYKKRLRHFEVYDTLEDTVKSAFKRMEQDNWN